MIKEYYDKHQKKETMKLNKSYKISISLLNH